MSRSTARKWRSNPELNEKFNINSSISTLPVIVVGRLVAFDGAGAPLVDYPKNPAGKPVLALAAGQPQDEDLGRNLALLFTDGDPARPFIVGMIGRNEEPEVTKGDENSSAGFEARVDGESVVIEGDKEVVLKCGKSSLTLTRAGKVLLRGAYVSSRSSGVNRIKGGSVQIN